MLVEENTCPVQQVGSFCKLLPQEAYGNSWHQVRRIEQYNDSLTDHKGKRHSQLSAIFLLCWLGNRRGLDCRKQPAHTLSLHSSSCSPLKTEQWS